MSPGINHLGSGKWRARYTWPRGSKPYAHSAPMTFLRREDAEAWLNQEKRFITDGAWSPPAEREIKEERASLTVGELIDRWLAGARLKVSTVQSHRRKLEVRVLRESIPGKFTSLRDEAVVKVDRARIHRWWGEICATWPTEASTNASAYKRLHTAFAYAVDPLDIIAVNPVSVPGAGKAPRPESRDRSLISQEEAKALADYTSDRLRIGVQLLLWSGLRIGELLELRRKDLLGLDGKGPVTVRIRRNVQRIKDKGTGKQTMEVMSTPKSDAGNRDIMLPGKIASALRAHASEHMGDGPGALVITTERGKQMMDTNFRSRFNRAAKLADRPDITPHDCRRFYGTWLVNAGVVSLEEARRLMGHETVEQLMEYQRSSQGFEKRAAEALNELIPDEDKTDGNCDADSREGSDDEI